MKGYPGAAIRKLQEQEPYRVGIQKSLGNLKRRNAGKIISGME
jgi:hypothetical protein